MGNPKVYLIFFIRVYTYDFRFSNDFQLGKIRKAFLAGRLRRRPTLKIQRHEIQGVLPCNVLLSKSRSPRSP